MVLGGGANCVLSFAYRVAKLNDIFVLCVYRGNACIFMSSRCYSVLQLLFVYTNDAVTDIKLLLYQIRYLSNNFSFVKIIIFISDTRYSPWAKRDLVSSRIKCFKDYPCLRKHQSFPLKSSAQMEFRLLFYLERFFRARRTVRRRTTVILLSSENRPSSVY